MSVIINPSAGAAVGSPISGGTPNEVLYVDGSGNLANSVNFTFNGSDATLGGELGLLTQNKKLYFDAGKANFLRYLSLQNSLSLVAANNLNLGGLGIDGVDIFAPSGNIAIAPQSGGVVSIGAFSSEIEFRGEGLSNILNGLIVGGSTDDGSGAKFQVTGNAHYSGGRNWWGTGTFVDLGSDAYMLVTATTGINAGFTASRPNSSQYASFDLLTNATVGTGWSMQMQPGSTDWNLVDRVSSANRMTATTGGVSVIGDLVAAGKIRANTGPGDISTSVELDPTDTSTYGGTIRIRGDDSLTSGANGRIVFQEVDDFEDADIISGHAVVADPTTTYISMQNLGKGTAVNLASDGTINLSGGDTNLSNKIAILNGEQTFGNWGVSTTSGYNRHTGKTAADTNVVSYVVGLADGSLLISANVLVTTATLHNFSVTVSYTDEGSTSRTATLQFSTLAGAFVTAITNAQGTVPYEGVPLHIRAKVSTAITIATTGTFTTVTYNVEGCITRIA